MKIKLQTKSCISNPPNNKHTENNILLKPDTSWASGERLRAIITMLAQHAMIYRRTKLSELYFAQQSKIIFLV